MQGKGVTIISSPNSTLSVMEQLVELTNVANAWLFKADRMVECAAEYRAFRAQLEVANKYLSGRA